MQNCDNIQKVTAPPLISVLMPVYNGENTIQRSLDSLLDQGAIPFELVVVNDCSTDKTSEVLEQFSINAPKHISVKIIQHEENGGVAKARNTALSHAIGEYVLWLDADDYYAPNSFVQLLSIPQTDVVGYNYYLQNEAKSRLIDCPKPNTPEAALKLICEGKMKWNLWAFMIRRKLIVREDIHFLSGYNMGEDLYFMGQVLLYAKDFQMLNAPLYHYMTSNEASLTKNYNNKHYDDIATNIKALEEIMAKVSSHDYTDDINFLKLTLKLPFLYSRDANQYKKWQELFPEANLFIDEYPSDHKYNQWLQKCAMKGQFWLVDLFNYVYKIADRLRY